MTCKVCGYETIMDGVCMDCTSEATDMGVKVLLQKKEDNQYYKVTSTCKEDIIRAFEDINTPKEEMKKIKKRVKSLKDNEMLVLASDLSDDYCEQLYWDSLRSIFEGRYMEVKK